ncbi:MAG: glutamate--tRNA ligase family protein [Thermoflexibacteraceae bacterium]
MFRSRIAPTPSGFLHIGNAFSFLYTWLLVQKYEGKLLLRIDDLDNERFRMAYLDDIFATLEWLGITYHEGANSPTDFLANYSQHKRIDLYQDFLAKLVQKNRVYACECSRSQIQTAQKELKSLVYPQLCLHKKIPLQQAETAWRVHIPTDTFIKITSIDCSITQLDVARILGDFVVRKKDGLPAYQIASVVDDLHYRINCVVRGIDLLPSTAAQLYLAKLTEQTDFQTIKFIHHSLLVDDKGNKLSKSQAATAIRDVRTSLKSATPIYQAFARWVGLPATVIQTLADLDYFFKAAEMPSVPLPTVKIVL